MKEINDNELETAAGGRSVNPIGYWVGPESRMCKHYLFKNGLVKQPGDPDSCIYCRFFCGYNQKGENLCTLAWWEP